MLDKPRYSRVSDIIDLIIFMQSKVNGVSIADIQDRFHVSRRTAERMRDSVLNIMPQVEEIDSPNERTKRWGFVNYSLREIINFSAEDVALLENISKNADEVSQRELKDIITKMKALNSKQINSIENEIEFLMHSEGYAIRQAPVYKIDLDILSTIRQGIKQGLKISAVYNGKQRILEPLGLLYGEKIHLIAREPKKGKGEYNYLLHKLTDVKLTEKKFSSKGFNLQEYANQSFGVYHGEIYDVELVFSKEVADDVMKYNFHPSQKVTPQKDGTVKVTFKASGDRHIIWHLFKWGTNVKILAPQKLVDLYKDYLKDVLYNLNK